MKLFLDACVIIYWQELVEPFYQHFQKTLEYLAADYPDATLATSRLSVLECCTFPLRNNDFELLKRYEDFFNHPGLELIEISAEVISKATDLRATENLRTPDAIQAASAITTDEVLAFITNDKAFTKLKDMSVILL